MKDGFSFGVLEFFEFLSYLMNLKRILSAVGVKQAAKRFKPL